MIEMGSDGITGGIEKSGEHGYHRMGKGAEDRAVFWRFSNVCSFARRSWSGKLCICAC